MTEYNFEYESLHDRIRDLETEIDRLKWELTETDNTIYEILNRLDNLEGLPYNTTIFKGA
jgi:predicted nuclease with TOPRIM domain